MNPDKCPVAVLISGGGTTLKNLLDWQNAGKAEFQVALVISSSENAGGLQFAEQAGIPSCVISKQKSDTGSQAFSEAIFQRCDLAEVRYVVMGGFLKLLPIPDRYEDRVINIHPSLIPAFCGKGFYGNRVHQSVLDYGCKVSGCTVHLVDNQFDHGPILAQATVEVRDGDTAAILQQRVFDRECELYPEVLNQISVGGLQRQERWVTLSPQKASPE